jgi:SAM-dependent methyltransferase
MSRVLEQELMLSETQVTQYAEACAFPGQFGGLAVYAIKRLDTDETVRSILDLGCGPCVYHPALYNVYPNALISAYDASPQMIAQASEYVNPEKTTLNLFNISDAEQSTSKFDLVFSSLVLHQLSNPLQLWEAVKHFGNPGSKFVVFDLLRIEGDDNAKQAVDNFIPVDMFGATFREDFKRSLLAAFTVDEITNQLEEAGLIATLHRIKAIELCVDETPCPPCTASGLAFVYIEGSLI